MTRPVPILFLFPALHVGGAERQMQALVRQLDRRHFLPIVATQHGAGAVAQELEAAGIPVHRLSNPRRFDVGFLPRTLALVRRHRVRIVCTQGFSTGVVGRLAACLGGAPVRIVLEHSTGERDMTAGRHGINRLLAPITSAWVAVAAGQVSYLTTVKHIPRERIHVVHNGIDPDPYDSGPQRATLRRRIRQEFGFEDSAPLAGSIAVLRPEKALKIFVRAAAQLLHALPSARFLLVGDGPERSALQEEIARLGLRGKVVMAGWRDDVAAVLSALDVAVLCSTDVETFPVAFLEAMAAGLPLVGTRLGGIPEMVAPGENGLLVSPGSEEELARALGEILGNLERARCWGDASRRRVRQEYGLDRMVRRYEALFQELLAVRGAIPKPRTP